MVSWLARKGEANMDYVAVAQGLLIPFLGTALGASLVFFLRRDMPPRLSKALVSMGTPPVTEPEREVPWSAFSPVPDIGGDPS